MYRINKDSFKRIVQSIITFVRQIAFLSSACWIILSELFLYGLFKNYSSFIGRLTHKLAGINILYVKVFQAFALNNSLIDDKLNNQLLQFTDNAPWNFSDIDFETLISVCDEYDLHLQSGFEFPINTGMISLVFKAYSKKDGVPLILKIKRVNIDTQLTKAVDNLLCFVYLLSFIPVLNKYQISEAVNKSISMITNQTNFRLEVENMQKMKKNCQNLQYVCIPSVNGAVTEQYENVILMEFIEGMTINKIDTEDYEEFAKQVLKFGFVTTVLHGLTHGDLHGGNILFIKDLDDPKCKHKIGVLDFGIVYEIDNDYKGILLEVATDLFTIPSNVLAEKFILSGVIEPMDVLKNLPQHHFDNIIKFSTEIIDDIIHTSKQANQIQVYRFLYNFNSYLTNHDIAKLGLRPSANFIKTQMCLAMSHGITLTLCKDDYIVVADKVLNELFHMNLLTDD
jgi:predicted unusual protein kinase regulating ubiquinone biosynthesis (AarF/ABC1/UbiB family)